jgi:hypothetical protein
MALLPWDDEEQKRKDELTAPGIAHIASVQSGAWQPAASGADSAVATDDVTNPGQGGVFGNQPQPAQQQPQPQNYQLSDEHTQAVQQKQAHDAEVEQARVDQENARRRAEAAAAVSEQFKEGNVQSNGQKLDTEALKNDNGWKKYYGDTFKKEKDSLDFWGRLMDGGQASKRAEVLARIKYNNELLTKAYDDNGNVLDQGAADYSKKVAAYNSALAQDNSNRSEVLARAIGATKDNEGSGFLNRLKNAVNAEKQMNIGSTIFGVDDTTKTDASDIGRFAGGLVQGFGTMIPVGLKELEEAGTGHGTSSKTGFEEDLTAGERVGRGISGGLNVVTPFVGGSGKLLDSLTTKVMTDTATVAEKSLLKEMTAKILLPALEQGGIGGAQAGAEYFGNGNTLLDENGNFDKDKLAEFSKQVGESAAMGTAGGVVLGGAGYGVNKMRGRNMPVLDAADLAELETGTTNSGAAQLDNMRAAETPGQATQTLDGTELQPLSETTPVADGVVTPDAPAIDQPTPVSDGTVTSQNADVTPVNAPDAVSTSAMLTDPNIAAPVADGTAQALPAEVTPVRDPVVDAATPAPVTPETPAPVDVAPVADGVAQVPGENVAPVRDMPVVPTEEVRALQESRAGKDQAQEAAINQELQTTENATPAIDNVPDMPVTPDGSLTPAQVAERFMPKLASPDDVKKRIANAVDMSKDTESAVRDILDTSDVKVKPKTTERIVSQFDKLKEQTMEYNRLTDENQKAYAEGGTDALSEETSKARSRAGRELGITARRLHNDIKRLEGSADKRVALSHGMAGIIGTRNANVLTSAGLIERNVFQEMTANLKLAAKNPIKMTKSTFANGNILKDTAKAELSHWGDAPRSPLEAVKYVVGNTYRTAMIPTTALANTRRGAVRDELTRWAFQELEGRKVSASEAHKLAGTAGNEMEALVNTVIGADNGMTNRGQAKRALDDWKEYMKTGDDGARAKYLSRVEEHSSLADQMIAGLSKEDALKGNALKQMGQLIFPFVRTAKNLAVTTVQQDLNPFAKSLLDEIRADQRGGTANAVNLIKSKLVDYGIMGGAAALASSGVVVYNDGDEVDKPKGWSIKVGDNKYVPVRATSLELPIAIAGTASRMATDIGKGDARDWKYYAGMITGSLPYIDQMNTTTGAVDSAMNANENSGDGGYAAKNYAVQTIKSFVPGSNNGIQPYVAGKEGKSLDAKTVYDKNFNTWLQNAIHKSYDPDFYNGLKTSRDNAGRARTVDNQGVVTNKTINDASTAEFNDRVTELVDYGRKNGLGKNTQDMFNTYDTGKNNNFKSVQDSITFLDVEDGGKPDAAKKLEKNGKLTNLSQQMREGFFGDTGDELLTLDGKNLYSDVSVPNSAGSKNSKLPISMQSIKNAIAQTDLSPEARDRIKEISDSDTALYNRLKAKEITYDQYQTEKAKTGGEYVDILSSSKNYQKMLGLFDELDHNGFFKEDGLGATKSGQTYLWNSLNALLGSKGATPAANFPDDSKGFTPWGNRGTGRSSKSGGNFDGTEGLKWTPVGRRQLANVATAKYTPVKIKVKLGNEIKRDRSQNYSDRSF